MKLGKIEKHIPAAEAIIEEIKREFITWTKENLRQQLML
jgi:hypothetical protein